MPDMDLGPVKGTDGGYYTPSVSAENWREITEAEYQSTRKEAERGKGGVR